MFFFAIFAAVVGAVVAQVAQTESNCLYNTTHCSCRINTETPGTCLRKESGTASDATCTVSTCSLGGYSCDCMGANVCEISTCSNWVPKDGTIASKLMMGTSVPCVQKADGTCLSKLDLPLEYKMVQFGNSSVNNFLGTMFNMSMFQDTNDAITTQYNMADKWDHHETLRYRHVTMRMYESTSGDVFLCGIYNTYGAPNDGLGGMTVKVDIKSLGGEALRWVACDDRSECVGGPGSTLSATHRLSFTYSDGWCVSPVNVAQGLSVKFSDLSGFEGISFQLSDGMDESYLFLDERSKGLGMSGEIDGNGLVRGGEIPEILFNLGGIAVPQ